MLYTAIRAVCFCTDLAEVIISLEVCCNEESHVC